MKFGIKKRQLITQTSDENQLLDDLAYLTGKYKSEIVNDALKRMAIEYDERLKKLKEAREMRNGNK